MSKETILLVGGAGYVGTTVTSHFLKSGYRIRVLDNFLYKNQFAVHAFLGDPDFELIAGDISDSKVVDRALRGVNHCVILAGLVGDPITKAYPDLSAKINERGVRSVIDSTSEKGLGKVIFISTCSNYGLIKETELADEQFALNPLSLYAKAKVSAEHYLLDKKGKVDYTGVVLRFATAFGLSPRMRFDLTVSEFTRDLYFGKGMVVYDEHTWRPYCHLRDFARLIETVIKSDDDKVSFEIFNAGGEVNNFTKQMIVDAILQQIPDGKISYDQAGSDPRNYRVDFSKVRSVLGFEPLFTVNDGIAELVDALKIGVFADSIDDKEKYGNYRIDE